MASIKQVSRLKMVLLISVSVLGIGLIAFSSIQYLPLGSLLVGMVSQKISAPLTMLCQGILALIITLIFSKYLSKQFKKTRPTEEKAENITHSN